MEEAQMLEEHFIKRRNVVWVVCLSETDCQTVLEKVTEKFEVSNVETSVRPDMPPVVSFSLTSNALRLEACYFVCRLNETVQHYTHEIDAVPLRYRAAIQKKRDSQIPIIPLEEALRA